MIKHFKHSCLKVLMVTRYQYQIEMLRVGKDSKWSRISLRSPSYRYPFAVTMNNEIFMVNLFCTNNVFNYFDYRLVTTHQVFGDGRRSLRCGVRLPTSTPTDTAMDPLAQLFQGLRNCWNGARNQQQ